MAEIAIQEEKEIQIARDDSNKIIEAAKALASRIVDSVSLNAAADFLLEIKRKRKWWAEWNKPAKQRLDALKKELLAREREIDEPMERAEDEILKPAMVRFEYEDARRRKDEEDRQRAEAKRKEEDARLKDAEALKKDGQHELADALLDAPIVIPPVVVPKTETPTGISYRDNWKYRVTDESKVPRQYLVLDDKKIGGVVRAMKGETRIEGIEVYSEKIIAGRT